MEILGQRTEDLAAQPYRPPAVRREAPLLARGGLIVTCPHSGRFYPPELMMATKLDPFTLRRSEDAFVDLFFQSAPSLGANLLISEFARAFVDVNRSPGELDPKLIMDVSCTEPEANSERVRVGLGVIPRTVGDSVAIYTHRITRQQAQLRLDEVHKPWHNEIERCLAAATHANGAAILLDCHSMPGHASGEPSCDVILGDRFGASCAPGITNEAVTFLCGSGLKVGRNNPYAGGYTTRRHGQTAANHHALQIEINRSLYMVEGSLTLRSAFQDVQKIMSELVVRLIGVSQEVGARAVSQA